MPEELDSRLSDAPAALTYPPDQSKGLGSASVDVDLAEDVELAQIAELVHTFANKMFERIRQNKHKGLRQEGWLQYTPDKYLIELQMNKEELRLALTYGVDVLDKAVDVAVDALIMWDQFANGKGLTGD